MLFGKTASTLKRIKEVDPAVHSNLELLLYPCIYAIALYEVANPLYKKEFFFLSRLVSQVARGLTGIEIHPGATIGNGLVIDHGMGVVIGETAIVGNNVTIYHGVTLGGTGRAKGLRHPIIEDNVTIGCGAAILGRITISEGSFIKANSLITFDKLKKI